MLSARPARPASQRSPSARRGPGAAPRCWRYGRGPQWVTAHREGPPRSCGRFPAYLAKDAARRQTGVNGEAARPGAARAWSLAPSRGVFQAGSVGVGRTASFSASFSALGESTRAAPPSWSCGMSSALAAWRGASRGARRRCVLENAPLVSPKLRRSAGGLAAFPFSSFFPFLFSSGVSVCLPGRGGPLFSQILLSPLCSLFSARRQLRGSLTCPEVALAS